MNKTQYKQITINSANKSENIQNIDVFSELKNTEPSLSVIDNNLIMNIPLNSEALQYLIDNQLKLVAHLVSSKSHSNFRLKTNSLISRNIYKKESLRNKTIPIGKVQNKCLKTTDINHSFYCTSQIIYPNINENLSILLLTIINYMTERFCNNKLTTGRFNHSAFKKYSSSAYFKFYIIVTPSYNLNFNSMNKYKRRNIHSKLSIPIVLFSSALTKNEITLTAETIDDYKHGKIEKLNCITIR